MKIETDYLKYLKHTTLPSLEKPIYVLAERELITQNCELKSKKKKTT